MNESRVYNYKIQLRAVLAIELSLLFLGAAIFLAFWGTVCDDSLGSCLASGTLAGPLSFLLLSAIRPIVMTPVTFVAYLGATTYGPFWGAILTAIGGVLSCSAIFAGGKVLGRRMVKPWLASNLPATWKFLRSQDYKIAFALRLVPFLPFDVLSLFFGALDFRTRSVLVTTFFSLAAESYLIGRIATTEGPFFETAVENILVLSVVILLPLISFEIWTRKRGGGLWLRAKAMFREISYEVKTNNEIVKRFDYVAEKPPVLLLYGFFASRRSLTVLERLLLNKGHQVLSFNLGGLLGTFFTRGITETAEFIDYKIKRQIERHGIQKIQIVAHSKGGLVALWWALRMGGAKYCDRIITMGTPFVGSRFTYLALATPLGFFFKDVWQMRPGSSFLRSLRSSEVPDSLKVYCLYSDKDGIAAGTKGLFRPFRNKSQVVGVPLSNISHFEFLYRKNVCEIISKILNDEYGQGDAQSKKNAG